MTIIRGNSEFIILDACCLLNLYASMCMELILQSLPSKIAISEYVYKEELLYHYSGPEENVRAEKTRISLAPFVDSGLIHVFPLDPDTDGDLFLRFAGRLDDGEATTCAIAIPRHWIIATDDKKTIRILKNTYSEIQIITTPEIVHYWAQKTGAVREETRDILNNIRSRGRYMPASDHPLHHWWVKNSNG